MVRVMHSEVKLSVVFMITQSVRTRSLIKGSIL